MSTYISYFVTTVKFVLQERKGFNKIKITKVKVGSYTDSQEGDFIISHKSLKNEGGLCRHMDRQIRERREHRQQGDFIIHKSLQKMKGNTQTYGKTQTDTQTDRDTQTDSKVIS
jgi:hypothetical protein